MRMTEGTQGDRRSEGANPRAVAYAGSGIEVAVGILLGTVVLFFGTLVCANWRMHMWVGIVYIAIYVIYIYKTIPINISRV